MAHRKTQESVKALMSSLMDEAAHLEARHHDKPQDQSMGRILIIIDHTQGHFVDVEAWASDRRIFHWQAGRSA